MAKRLPNLPELLKRKLYKTGQTRGADDDEIYQNRVSRGSTVLIPYAYWARCAVPSERETTYEKGYIVLLTPQEYFENPDTSGQLKGQGLALGENAVVFYKKREDWNAHSPDNLKWKPAEQRLHPVGGEYVARIAATTATDNGGKINRGFNRTSMKGAGIRVYEYASSDVIQQCRLQLEMLFWVCRDARPTALSQGMSEADIDTRKAGIEKRCKEAGLLDVARLREVRAINDSGVTVCPLCLAELASVGFFQRMAQAEGRSVHDLTVTELNLFHIEELRTGSLNHRPYNLAWGHHHCNVVARDSGIAATLLWMQEVIERNRG